MKYNKLTVSALVLAILLSAAPVLAEQGDYGREVKTRVTASTTADRLAQKNQATINRLKSKATQEIERRTKSLTELNTRIQALVKISTEQKTAIGATIQTQIQALAVLKTKIDADTDIEVLKSDVKSITDSYRIYALIMPQIQIIAAADRLSNTADMMGLMGVKLQSRIAEVASTTSRDVAAAQLALTDLNSKVADAKVQAQAAINAIVTLVPDGGDKVKMAANRAALDQARKILKIGEQDLKAARKDAEKITKLLRTALHIERKDNERFATSTESKRDDK